MRYVLVSPPGIGDRAWPEARPAFLFAISTGEDALTDPDALTALAASVHCDVILCEKPPPDSLLAMCAGRGVLIAVPSGDVADSDLSSPATLSMARFSRTPDSFLDRESWAVAAALAIRQAREDRYDGICLADTERLLNPANEPLRWHLTCLCRRIIAAVGQVSVEGWTGSGMVPLRSDLNGVTLASLDIQWELMDGDRVAARGRAEGSDDPPLARFKAPPLGDPAHWTHEPRLRLRFHLPEPRPARNVSPAAEASGDVLVVRRSQAPAEGPSGAVQIGGLGREIARIEVPLRILPPMECELRVTPVLGRYPAPAITVTMLRNHTPAPLEAELQLTLRPARGRPRAMDGRRLLIDGGQSAAITSNLSADALAPGSNYVLAGVQSSAGVTLSARLLYRNDGPGRLFYFGNTRVEPARFWHWALPERPPVRVRLEGWEESVESAAVIAGESALVGEWVCERMGEWRLGDEDERPTDAGEWEAASEGVWTRRARWQSGREGDTAEDRASVTADSYADGLIRVVLKCSKIQDGDWPALWLPLPADWLNVHWRRRAFWDNYPRSHPDAPRGSLPAPVDLSQVECVVITGDGAGIALLAGEDRLNAQITPGALKIEPAQIRRVGQLEFGIYPVQKPEDAEGLWLRRPPHVCQITRAV